jgi:hypothetical protein
MTIGDVLAVIAAVSLLGASWAATLLLAALAFPERTLRAQQRVEAAPGACLLRGLLALLVIGLPALALGQSPAGPVRLVAGALWAGLAAIAALGGAGVVRLLGERIESAGTQMPPFAALTRATLLFVTAGFLPLVGWFLVVPAAALVSLGGGFCVLRAPRKPRPARPVETAAMGPVS